MTGETYPNIEELHTLKNITNADEIAFYGGTFTGLPQKFMIELLSVHPNIPKRISTRPDCIDESIITILKEWNVKTIELGIESLDNEVLSASNRGYTSETVFNAIELIKPHFEIIAHLMVGLPKDSKEKDIATVKDLIKLGIKEYRIHPTLVFKNTKLEEMYKNNQYVPLSIDEALDIVSDMVILIEGNGGKVLRMAYHVPQSQLQFVVAGPYHPSFGDMVRAHIIRKIINKLEIKKVKYPKKFASWFNSYGNTQLNVIKEETDNTNCEIIFDNLLYNKALQLYMMNS